VSALVQTFVGVKSRRQLMTTPAKKLADSVSAGVHQSAAPESISIISSSDSTGSSIAAPVSKEERIFAIDLLRGFALLGILILNIVFFGLPAAAYLFPIVAGGSSGWNYAAWFAAFSLAEGKMRAMFSMMFGASVLLLSERLSRRGAEVADIHYRRMLWLMLFGLLHAYLTWKGDILFYYAICGLFLYPLRKLSPKALILSACVLFLFISGEGAVRYVLVRNLQAEYLKVEEQRKAGKKPTTTQEETRKEWIETSEKVFPPADKLQEILDAHHGSYLDLLKYRAKRVFEFHSVPLYVPSVYFDMLEMMLIGMALLKMDILSGGRSRKFYIWMAVIGFGIGVPSHAIMGWMLARQSFSVTAQRFAMIVYDFGRAAVFGYCAALLLLLKSGLWRGLTSRLAAVGQMAFSNYIFASLICGIVFDGYGFGLFGRLQRWQLYPIMLAIWILQMEASRIWLRHFRFGPLEWCWRSLTYYKAQPMRL
jgi:uncharacterized protein